MEPTGPSHTGADLTVPGKAEAQPCVQNKLFLHILISRNINANDLIICIMRTIKLMLLLKEKIPPWSSLEMTQAIELISCKLAAQLHSVLSPPGTLLFLTPCKIDARAPLTLLPRLPILLCILSWDVGVCTQSSEQGHHTHNKKGNNKISRSILS